MAEKQDSPAMPIERKRGPRPANWSISDQINEDHKAREVEWNLRQQRKGTSLPFPGLSRGKP